MLVLILFSVCLMALIVVKHAKKLGSDTYVERAIARHYPDDTRIKMIDSSATVPCEEEDKD